MGILMWKTLMATKVRIVVPHIFLYDWDNFLHAPNYFTYTIN